MSSNFKAIIVGAGPAGLIAAHALHHAQIDFVLLERRENFLEDVGASLVLDPGSLRVMAQLGLLEKLKALGQEMKGVQSLTREGQVFKENKVLSVIKENHGCAPAAFHRAELIRTIYEGLPAEAKAKILSGKSVNNIEQTESSVTVSCTDASSFTGSIVIGADGVHSQTRRQMRKAVIREDPEAKWDDERPFEANYRCLWGNFPLPAEVEPGTSYETQHKDRSIMFLAGKSRGWIFLYEKLDAPTKERVTYTSEDLDAYAASFADWPITKTLKVSDVYNKKTAGMSNLEEGVVNNFSSGRVVLVGDACHKFTPNAGLGLNNGIQDVAALCNGIHATVAATTDGQPDKETLSHVFDTYREKRLSLIQGSFNQSAMITHMHSWSSPLFWLMARYILPLTFAEVFLVRYVAAQKIRRALVLDYVAGEEPFKGQTSWLHSMQPLTN